MAGFFKSYVVLYVSILANKVASAFQMASKSHAEMLIIVFARKSRDPLIPLRPSSTIPNKS